MTVRSGIGYDVHPLVEGRPLILGGATVPFSKGLQGHSDGDVLVHALIDALLGAVVLGDIGVHFPSSDQRYRGAYSLDLLAQVQVLLLQQGWRVAHVDATIVAEMPRLRPFVDQMRQNIARALEMAVETVSIKATTTDGLGFAGRGEGMAALAVATVVAATG